MKNTLHLKNLHGLQKVTCFSKAGFEGFTLKKGYWYGFTEDGQAIATSTWVCEEGLAIYKKITEDHWEREFLPKKHWNLLPDSLVEELQMQ